jgi:hypothetical protein
MNVPAISSAAPTANLSEVQKAAPTPPVSKSTASSYPTDTVTLSAAAQGASKAGDVDHDGDSH